VDASEVTSRTLPTDVVGSPIQMDLVDSLQAGLRLFPATRQVYVITGKAKFDQFWEREARRQLPEIGQGVELVFLSGLPMADLEQHVAALPEDSLVYYLHIFQDGTGKVYIPAEALNILATKSSVPVFSHVESYLGHGIVGGRVFSFEQAGRKAGELAARVLQGERPEEIGISAPLVNTYVFDWREMQRWSIRESSLPRGSEVRFKQPTVWEAYRWQMSVVLGAVLLQGLLILGLVFERFQRARAESARRLAEVEVRQSQAALRELTGKLLGAQESERGRIARELHDDLGQGLALLAVELDMLKQSRSQDISAVLAKADKLSARVKQLSSSVHDLSHQLHPMKLEQLGLAAAIGGLCKEVSEGHELPVHFDHQNVPHDVSPPTALCLYRIAQEGLQNVIKHSRAARASVSLRSVDSSLVLSIQDDGRGLDTAKLEGTQGIGLAGMRERVRLVNGTIEIASGESGTQITITVPV
jgi:signal transduction histidine kinase